MTVTQFFQKTANVLVAVSGTCCMLPFLLGFALTTAIALAILAISLAMLAVYRSYQLLHAAACMASAALKMLTSKVRKASRKLYRTALYYEYRLNMYN